MAAAVLVRVQEHGDRNGGVDRPGDEELPGRVRLHARRLVAGLSYHAAVASTIGIPKGGLRPGSDGFDFEECEHIVGEDDPDTALCGVDQADVPWDQGFPVCQACLAVAEGRMS
jgi:hypothetical protein